MFFFRIFFMTGVVFNVLYNGFVYGSYLFTSRLSEIVEAHQYLPTYIGKDVPQFGNKNLSKIRQDVIKNIGKKVEQVVKPYYIFENFQNRLFLNSIVSAPTRKNLADVLSYEAVHNFHKLQTTASYSTFEQNLQEKYAFWYIPKESLKTNIAPAFSHAQRKLIQSVLHMVVEQGCYTTVPRINAVIADGTNPITMPGATRPTKKQNEYGLPIKGYDILLSPELSDQHLVAVLVHELGHVLRLDCHRVYEAECAAYKDSLIKKFLFIEKNIAAFRRSIELHADTEIVLGLKAPKTALVFAEYLFEIYFYAIIHDKIKNNIDESVLFSDKYAGSFRSHPTFPLRLVLMAKVHNLLQSEIQYINK